MNIFSATFKLITTTLAVKTIIVMVWFVRFYFTIPNFFTLNILLNLYIIIMYLLVGMF